MYKMLVVISIVVFLFGCRQTRKGEINMGADESSKATQAMFNSNEIPVYNDEQLSEISNLTGTRDDILSRYHTGKPQTITMLQSPNDKTGTGDGNLVIYRGNTMILMLIFDSYGNKLSSNFYDMALEKSAFDTICIGSSLSEVQTLDPKGQYLFLYTGTGEPRVSTHCTSDGFLINITYGKNNIVENIDIFPLW